MAVNEGNLVSYLSPAFIQQQRRLSVTAQTEHMRLSPVRGLLGFCSASAWPGSSMGSCSTRSSSGTTCSRVRAAIRTQRFPDWKRTRSGWPLPCGHLGRGCRWSLHPLAAHGGLALGDQRTRPPWLDARRLGLFNLVEGIVDHHILTIHHVLELKPDRLGSRVPRARCAAGD